MSEEWERAIAGYLNSLRGAGRRPRTVELYRHYARLLAHGVAPPDPWTVTADDLATLIGNVEWGPSARKSLRTVVGGFYGWALVTGRIDHNPSVDLPRVRVPRGRPRPAPETVILDALERAEERTRLMIELGALAGLRASEISQVHRRDFEDGILLVHGKGGKDRHVPIPSGHLAAALRAAPGWLFPNEQRGGHLTGGYVSKVLSGALGEHYTGHQLRHRFGTKVFAVTRDLLAVSELLGHASTETTRIYVEMPSDHLRHAVEAAALPTRLRAAG